MRPAGPKISTDSKNLTKWKLFLISLASVGLYLILAIKFPLRPSLEDPRASWVSLVGDDLPWIIFQILIYFCLFWLYTKAIRILQPAVPIEPQNETSHTSSLRWAIPVILLGWLVCSAVLLSSAAAGESHDIFDYVFRGRMMVEYRANPLVEIPKTYSRAHFYLYTAWYQNVDTYGPIWEMASAGIAGVVHIAAALFGGMNSGPPSCPESPEPCRWLVIYLTGYRLFAIILTGGSAVIIARIMRNFQPALVNSALAAWLWNPMTLMSSAMGGHNDFLMLVLILICLLMMQKQKYFLALLALILAAHVKLTALIWVPMVLLWIVHKLGWRSGIRLGIQGLAAGLVLSWVLYLPFNGWASLPQMLNERTQYFANSIWKVFYNVLNSQGGWLIWSALYLTQHLPNWLSLAGSVIIPFHKFHISFKPGSADDIKSDDQRLWMTATAVALSYLIVGAFWFQHWYLLWVLAPAVLLANRAFILQIYSWLGFGALSANFLGGFLLSSAPDGALRNLVYMLIVIMIWVPGLAAYLAIRRPSRKVFS